MFDDMTQKRLADLGKKSLSAYKYAEAKFLGNGMKSIKMRLSKEREENAVEILFMPHQVYYTRGFVNQVYYTRGSVTFFAFENGNDITDPVKLFKRDGRFENIDAGYFEGKLLAVGKHTRLRDDSRVSLIGTRSDLEKEIRDVFSEFTGGTDPDTSKKELYQMLEKHFPEKDCEPGKTEDIGSVTERIINLTDEMNLDMNGTFTEATGITPDYEAQTEWANKIASKNRMLSDEFLRACCEIMAAANTLDRWIEREEKQEKIRSRWDESYGY